MSYVAQEEITHGFTPLITVDDCVVRLVMGNLFLPPGNVRFVRKRSPSAWNMLHSNYATHICSAEIRDSFCAVEILFV